MWVQAQLNTQVSITCQGGEGVNVRAGVARHAEKFPGAVQCSGLAYSIQARFHLRRGGGGGGGGAQGKLPPPPPKQLKTDPTSPPPPPKQLKTDPTSPPPPPNSSKLTQLPPPPRYYNCVKSTLPSQWP